MEKISSPVQIKNLIIHSWPLVSLSIPSPIPLKLTIQNANSEKKPSQLVAKWLYLLVMAQDDRARDGVFVCVGRQSGECGFNFVVTHSGGGLERVLSLFRSHV
ncbi:TPA: hypothetical protein ACXLW6_003082, partial [Yersinia enterocolitica]